MKRTAQSDFPIPPEAEELAKALPDVKLAFANLVLTGSSHAEAYRQTHRKCSKAAAWNGGSRLARDFEVKAYLDKVREVTWKENLVGYHETLARLGELIRNPMTPAKYVLAAMALNAKLGGFDRPQEAECDESGELDLLEQAAARILPTLDLPGARGENCFPATLDVPGGGEAPSSAG